MNQPSDWLESRDLPSLLEKVRPHTMVAQESLVDLARIVRTVISQNIPGDLVECGAWKGGASFMMADLLKRAGCDGKKVWLFDSFEGIQPPEEIDGPRAKAWAADTDSAWHFDNLRVSVEAVQRAANTLGVGAHTRLVKGWFDKTLPATREQIGPIALLRIDADWHASVSCCLENLFDQVVEGGFVIFDDYYTYDGCAVAVHQFMGTRGLPHRIESIVGHAELKGAVFRKGKTTWKWLHELYLLEQDLAGVIGPEDRFIFVDEDTLRMQLQNSALAIPYLEKDGQCWGAPADDAAAIAEVERQQRAGAAFLVFTWPAFWYLDHYKAFAQSVRDHFACVLRNERVVVFDLREKS